MEKVNIWDVEGTEFPAGRRTRVIIGQNGAMKGEKFCQGYVVIYKDGGIPEHDHETVESYTILKGHGIMDVDGEKQEVKEGDCVFIPSGKKHSLYNQGDVFNTTNYVEIPNSTIDLLRLKRHTVTFQRFTLPRT